jgi:NitT/TauT family transport system substrate-binding protein
VIRDLGREDEKMRGLLRLVAGALAMAVLSMPSAFALQKVRIGMNWLPEGEHCGFYQARATGLYEKAGLDVDIRPGGPDQNVAILVASGQEDLAMGSNFTTLNLVEQGTDAEMVAAYLQKDPQTLVAHPDQGIVTLNDLKGRPIMVAKFSQGEFWQFLKAKFGFEDSQIRPYTYNAAVFLSDPKSVQQGYVTEDEFFLGKAMKKPPVIMLLADYGYLNYASALFGMKSYIDHHPDIVQAVVNATAEGYYQCMTGDYSPATKAITTANPDHSAALMDFKVKQMRDRGMVLGGDASKLGAGAMTDARWKEFFETMVKAGVYKPTLDYKAAYTLQFTNKGVGAAK